MIEETTKNLLIIDGYNLIHALKKLQKLPLEAAVEEVIEWGQEVVAAKEWETVVVFDAPSPRGTKEAFQLPFVRVVYAGSKGADAFIEELVLREASRRTVYVASSDYSIQKVVFSKGALRMSPRELEELVEQARQELLQSRNSHRVSLEERLDPETRRKLNKFRRNGHF
jgi:hypothetical protein